MKKLISKSPLFALIVTVIFISGCLGEGNTGGLARVFNVSMNISNFNEQIFAGNDTLTVREVVFHVPLLNIITPNGDTLQSNSQNFIFRYDQTSETVAQQVIGDIQFEFDDYDRFEFRMEPITILTPVVASKLSGRGDTKSGVKQRQYAVN